MKRLKKILGLVTVVSALTLAACGNPVTTKISPVEDSGERISCTAVSVALPKNWAEGAALGQYDGLTVSKGLLNTVSVVVMDVPGAEETVLEDVVDSMKINVEATGVTVSNAEVKEYDFGKAICIDASGEITQELIDTNIMAGLCTEEQAKMLKGIIGKNKNESVIYFFKGDQIIAVDGITFGDEASGIKEATEFIANSMTLN